RRTTRSSCLWRGTTDQGPTSTDNSWQRSQSRPWARSVRSRRAATTRAIHPPMLTSRRTSPSPSSVGRERIHPPADFYRNFYRNFYRTGRNRVEASNTVQHGNLQNRRSEALFNIDQHRSKPPKIRVQVPPRPRTVGSGRVLGPTQVPAR